MTVDIAPAVCSVDDCQEFAHHRIGGSVLCDEHYEDAKAVIDGD